MAYSLERTVKDSDLVPISGAQVYVYDQTGALANLVTSGDAPTGNPLTSDSLGYAPVFVAVQGYYTLKYFWGGRLRLVETQAVAGAAPLDVAISSAQSSAASAALSAVYAEAMTGPTYASTALGLAATTEGQAFAVDAGGGLVSIYLNSAGTAVLQRTLATTAYLASSAGAGAIGLADGRTVQTVLGLSGGRFYEGTAANLLIRRATAGASRVHIEPNGYIDSGVSTKLDWMYDPYDLDNANYRIFNIYNSTGDLNGTGESGITFIGCKNVGNHFGLWSSIHFGFSDDGASACAMKIHYIDTTAPQHYTPAKGGWRSGKNVTTGDYVTSLVGGTGRIYQAASTGTCGATVPSHTSGTVSDGGVDWTFVRAVSSANIRPIVLFGARDDMPKLGLTANVQHARDEVFWNGKKMQFADSTNAVAWSIYTNGATDDLLIESASGGYLRLDNTGKFIQLVGLALAAPSVTATDLSATPSIAGARTLVFNNSGPTSVTSFSGGIGWQEFYVRAGNGQTTLVHSASLRLVGKANRVLTANDCLMFQMNSAGTAATEVGYRD